MKSLISTTTHQRLSERVYEALKEYILAQEYNPGQEVRLDEKQLITQLQVSRTPVREAMARLIAEGLLYNVPYKGVFIAHKTEQEIISIIMVRAVLEGMSARLATANFKNEDFPYMRAMFQPFLEGELAPKRLEFSRANVMLHEFILKRSECDLLIDMAQSLYDQMRMVRFRTSIFPARLESALDQHFKLVDLFEQRQAAEAEALMRSHIEESIQYIAYQEESKKIKSPDEYISDYYKR